MTLTINGKTQICNGDSTVLTAVADMPVQSYVWNNGGTTANIIVHPDAETVYGVTVTDEGGCTVSANFNVTVLSNPVATISIKPIICFGTPGVPVTVTPTEPLGTISGTGANGLTGLTFLSTKIDTATQANRSLTLKYDYIDNNGCKASAETNFNVHYLRPPKTEDYLFIVDINDTINYIKATADAGNTI